VQIAISALTLDLLLFITLMRTLPPKDAVVSFSFNVFITLALILGNWTGAEEKEVELVVIPFAYLVGTSVFLFLHRAGISEVQERFGVSQDVGQWLTWASIGIFLGANLWLYGWGNWFVGVALAWYGIGFVYKKLG
jgi:hypothetical protein